MRTPLERVRIRLKNQGHRLDRLEEALPEGAPGTHDPLVVQLHRRGGPTWDNEVESRAPGIYREGGGVDIVFDGDEPPAEWVARFQPASGPGPLFISFGPCEIEPPADAP